MQAYSTFAAISQAFTNKPVLRTFAESFDQPAPQRKGLTARAKAFFGEGLPGVIPVRRVKRSLT